jgi:putative Mn2+ efflux pump MntP
MARVLIFRQLCKKLSLLRCIVVFYLHPPMGYMPCIMLSIDKQCTSHAIGVRVITEWYCHHSYLIKNLTQNIRCHKFELDAEQSKMKDGSHPLLNFTELINFTLATSVLQLAAGMTMRFTCTFVQFKLSSNCKTQ